MFTLNSFSVRHKNKQFYNCIFNEKNKSTRDSIFTTLIIGENGVGKSFLLSTLLDFFRYVGALPKNRTFKYDEVDVAYTVAEDYFSINKRKDIISFNKNGADIDFNDLKMPSKLLALSFMVNDKFAFTNNTEDSYKYLGVRTTSNATYTSSIQKKLLNSFLLSIRDRSRIEALEKVFNFLELRNVVKAEYTLKRKTLFQRGISVDFIIDRLNTINRRKDFYSDRASEAIQMSAKELVGFIKDTRHLYDENKKSITYEIVLSGSNSNHSDAFKFFEMMEILELISPPVIKFYKEDDFNFEYTSSGEKHFIYTMVNLISQIEENSLIVIDEPELSLHPRWQMKYIKLIKEITKNFSSSHCILASHSHFMVSDLDPISSSLIALSNQNVDGIQQRVSDLIEYDTYAWSAENILYQVFKLRTTRNYYFEKDLSELLNLISSRSKESGKIRSLQKKLTQYRFDNNDPINLVLSQTHDYLESLSND